MYAHIILVSNKMNFIPIGIFILNLFKKYLKCIKVITQFISKSVKEISIAFENCDGFFFSLYNTKNSQNDYLILLNYSFHATVLVFFLFFANNSLIYKYHYVITPRENIFCRWSKSQTIEIKLYFCGTAKLGNKISISQNIPCGPQKHKNKRIVVRRKVEE